MRKLLLKAILFISGFWGVISFLGSFYFPYFSPRYAESPVAIRLKELAFYFIPGDIALLVSTIIVFLVLFGFSGPWGRKKLLLFAGILSIAKGFLNTVFYWIFLKGITPSFLNIFSGLLIIIASFLEENTSNQV